MGDIYDVVIIGSGPAGLSAAVYAKRAELNVVVIEKSSISGGQIVNTSEVDNYLGIYGVAGFDLAARFREHADKFGVEFVTDEVVNVEDGKVKMVVGKKQNYRAKAVIIATGATYRKLNISGEKELLGKGVSYCATCDGAFFKGKEVAVVGGGDVALEDAIVLSRLCKKVYVIHRRNEFRAARQLQRKLHSLNNIEIVWDTVVDKILGEDKVEAVILSNKKTNTEKKLNLDGIFIAVGMEPNSEAFLDIVKMNESGYIVAGEDTNTSARGIFAAGDIRTKTVRQIITAVSDGANAISSVEKYLY